MLNRIFRKVLRILFRPFIRKELFDYSNHKKLITITKDSFSIESTSEFIAKGLENKKPLMISRFGYTELNTLMRYENISKMNTLEKIYQWAETSSYPFSGNCRLNNIHKLSGFFPVTEESLFLFKREMISSIKQIDLLGSWVEGENKYKQYFPQVKVCELFNLEPYFAPNPWTSSLEGKKVLVIHPFSKLIEEQYSKKRTLIFDNKNILPEFELKTLKTPITYPGGGLKFQNWFEILDNLTDCALHIDFEIAIIGCGAYGMPLAARLKKAGKKSIHLGGAVQILFGIKGKRWDEMKEFRKLYNEFWIYPSKEKVYKNVEDGCYW